MKKTVFLIVLASTLQWASAQNSSNVEITNSDIMITTANNGKAYYNNQEIATVGIHARAAFNKVNLPANVRTYLSAQAVQGTPGMVNLNNVNDLIVIPEDGYYLIDIGPIRLSSSYPALLEGRLIAKAPGTNDWVVVHLNNMDEAGTTYPGFSRMLYLTTGTLLEFGLTANTATTLVSIGEITDNNELCIVKII